MKVFMPITFLTILGLLRVIDFSESLKCYECTDSNCNKDIKKLQIHKDCKGYCYSVTVEHYKMKRSCIVDKNVKLGCKNFSVDLQNQVGSGRVCFCNFDLCNRPQDDPNKPKSYSTVYYFFFIFIVVCIEKIFRSYV